MKKSILFLSLLSGILLVFAQHEHKAPVGLPKTPSPEGARTYIISPSNGETVPKTFTVKFGLHGMGIAPAGIKFDDTGHHHLLVDVDKMPDLNMPLPATDKIIHFGKGQTETRITLEPGKHTLRLVLGDYLHIAHDPPVVSKQITVNVVE